MIPEIGNLALILALCLALVQGIVSVIASGLGLLGVSAPEEMR